MGLRVKTHPNRLHLLQSCFSFFVRIHGQSEPIGSCIILQSCSPCFNLLRVARCCCFFLVFCFLIFASFLYHAEFGSMSPAEALKGLPTYGTDIATARPEARRERNRLEEGQPEVTDMLTNLLQAPVEPSAVFGGVYIGEGLAPSPANWPEKIWQWEFVDMDG